jgi:hypothetical protein
MSFRNPNSEISAEISKTLETPGLKSQNSWKCNPKLVGGALKEAVQLYALFIPNVQVTSVDTPQRSRPYNIFGNPRRAVRFCRRERGDLVDACAMGSFETYDLISCLFFNNIG